MVDIASLSLIETSQEQKDKAKNLIYWILKSKEQTAKLEAQLTAIDPAVSSQAVLELEANGIILQENK